jgi:indole-3-glycerol phosphate synthase
MINNDYENYDIIHCTSEDISEVQNELEKNIIEKDYIYDIYNIYETLKQYSNDIALPLLDKLNFTNFYDFILKN